MIFSKIPSRRQICKPERQFFLEKNLFPVYYSYVMRKFCQVRFMGFLMVVSLMVKGLK